MPKYKFSHYGTSKVSLFLTHFVEKSIAPYPTPIAPHPHPLPRWGEGKGEGHSELVGVESSTGFSAQVPRIDILLQERAGAIFGISESPVKYFHNCQTRIQTD